MKRYLTLLLLLVVLPLCSSAQEQQIPSTGELKAQLQNTRKIREQIPILQNLSQAYIFRPQALSKDMDSARYYTDAAEKLANTLNLVQAKVRNNLLYAQIEREQRHREPGRQFATTALSLATENGWEALRGDSFLELSKYFGWGSELPDKIKLLEQALAAYRKGGSSRQLADILTILAEQHLNISDYKKVVTEGKEAVKIYKSIDVDGLQALYNVMGIAYTKLGFHEEGLRYSLLAAKEWEKRGDESMNIASIYNHIGLSYFFNQDYALAKDYHRKSLKYAIKNDNHPYIHTVAGAIVNDMYPIGQGKEALVFLKDIVKRYPPEELEEKLIATVSLITVYRELNQLTLAGRYSDELLALSQDKEEQIRPSVMYIINNALLSYYFRIKEYKRAATYLERSRKIAEASGDNATQRYVHMWSFKLDSVAGNYPSAIRNFQKYTEIKDSIYNEAKTGQLAELQVQYETQKKDHALKENAKDIQLLKKEAEIQKAKIRADGIIKIVVFIVAGLLAVIMLLLYRSYSIKKKTNQALKVKQREIESKNNTLGRLVDEKEWLLKEIHHRVKNNLQIVMGLLNSQCAYLKDQSAITAIQDSQHRVQSMSLIHQKLYKSYNLSAINMPEYISELVDYLKDSFNLGLRVHFQLNVEDIDMDVSQAVPIGLILNEAITNAIKYAFPDGHGRISVSLQHVREDVFTLTIADNGIGLPSDIEAKKQESLGMRLMQGLSDDLEGNFKLFSENGTVISLEFVYQYRAGRT